MLSYTLPFKSFASRLAMPALMLALLGAAPSAFAQSISEREDLFAHVTSPGQAANGSQSVISPLVRTVAGFFSVGGYYFTDRTATRALGTPKFYGDTQIFAKPKHFPLFDVTGGLEIVSANDHFFPFQGGNEFNLIGPAFKVSTRRVVNRITPFVSGGLFLGRARSITANPGFDRSNFAPSISVGVEYPLRYITLYGSYRINQQIHSIDTDGASFGVRFFH